jgi:hypothetical protein
MAFMAILSLINIIMKKLIFFIILSFSNFLTFSQDLGKFSLSANFGLNGNFFVRSYDELGGPTGVTSFLKKDFVGKAGGIETIYHLNKRSDLSLGYTHSENKSVVSYSENFNYVQLLIKDFTIRHLENIFHFSYKRVLFKKIAGLRGEIGIFYSRTIQQEIDILPNVIVFQERKFSNANFNEGGAFIGLQYAKKIDTHFELGIQSRLFYEISSDILAQITLTPTLAYHFAKSKKKKS